MVWEKGRSNGQLGGTIDKNKFWDSKSFGEVATSKNTPKN